VTVPVMVAATAVTEKSVKARKLRVIRIVLFDLNTA